MKMTLIRIMLFVAPVMLQGCIFGGSLPSAEMVGEKDFPLDQATFEKHEEKYHSCFKKLMAKDEEAHKKPGFVQKMRQCVGRPMSTAIACKITANQMYGAEGGSEKAVDEAFHKCLKAQNDPIAKCFLEGAEVLANSSSHTRGDRATRHCLMALWDDQ